MDKNTTPAGAGEPVHPPKQHVVHLTLSYRVLVVLAILLIVPWVLALMTLGQHTPLQSGGSDHARGAHANGTLAGGPLQGNPGPWGDIEYIPINIAPPSEFIGAANWDFGPSEWHFPNMTLDKVQAFLSETGLSDPQRAALLGGLRPSPEISGFVVSPSDEILKGLSVDARGRLYRFLAQSPLNRAQVNAFRFAGKTPEEWVGSGVLEPATADLLKSLIYRNGHYMLFADLPLLAPILKTPEQRETLLRTLAHEHTFLMRLKIDEKTDVDALAAYWGRGGRAKDVRPLMEAMAELPGTHTLPVTYLLPGFARRRIYTYPSVSEEPNAANRDCHWTALNFFNEEPDDRLGDRPYAAKVIQSDYYVISNNYQLGDLVLFMSAPGEVIHSAVYLADDVLFTKQGSRPSNPWMLVRLEDMKDFYPTETPLTIKYFRHKGV